MAQGKQSKDRRPTPVKYKAQPGRRDAVQCPYCGHWGCPMVKGVKPGADLNRRECKHCLSRFTTRVVGPGRGPGSEIFVPPGSRLKPRQPEAH